MNENLIEALKESISKDKIKEIIVIGNIKEFPVTITKEELEKRWKE